VDELYPDLRSNAMLPPRELKTLMKEAASKLGVPINCVHYTVNYSEEQRRDFNIERLCYMNVEKVCAGYAPGGRAALEGPVVLKAILVFRRLFARRPTSCIAIAWRPTRVGATMPNSTGSCPTEPVSGVTEKERARKNGATAGVGVWICLSLLSCTSLLPSVSLRGIRAMLVSLESSHQEVDNL
jgi:hypothetical protein